MRSRTVWHSSNLGVRVRAGPGFGNLFVTLRRAPVVVTVTGSGRLPRRGFIIGGLGLGIGAVQGCSRGPGGPPASTPAGLTAESLSVPTTSSQEPVSVEKVHSPARGTSIDLVTIRPAGATGRLPVCLALHGRSANAQSFLNLGVPEVLNAVTTAGTKPFAVVCVDGGDSYWVARTPSDDPQKMLTDDLPTWLANRGFATTPFAAFGISMGGYGALNYARNPGLNAVAAISSALFENWTEAKARNAFADEAQWEATEPLRHVDAIKAGQLGVWCGANDPFVNQSRRLIDLASPRVSAISAGEHNDTYWRRILPEVLRFVGDALP